MKKRLPLLLIFSSLLLSSCGIRTNFDYEDGDSYSIGPGEVSTNITNIDIDWINGAIEIKNHDEDTILINEEYKGDIAEDDRLRYLVDGDTLKIKYRKASNHPIHIKATKNLVLTVPSSLKIDSYLIDSISGEVKGNLYANIIKIDGVSGGADLTANCDNFICNFISGNSNITFSNSPNEIKLNSVSGDGNIHLPNSTGFILSFKAISGSVDISEDFNDVSEDKNTYKYGDESIKINVSTTSGNINISK